MEGRLSRKPRGGQIPATDDTDKNPDFIRVIRGLLCDDCFDLIALQESDHSVAAIPEAVSGAPDLVSFDFAAAH